MYTVYIRPMYLYWFAWPHHQIPLVASAQLTIYLMRILAAIIFKSPFSRLSGRFAFIQPKSHWSNNCICNFFLWGKMCYKALQDLEEELFIVGGGTDTVNRGQALASPYHWSNEKSLEKICRHDSHVEMSLVYCSFSYNGKEFNFFCVGSMN